MFKKSKYQLSFIIGIGTFLLFPFYSDANAQRTLQLKKSETLRPIANKPSDADPAKELFFSGVNQYLDQYGIKLGLNWVTETAGVVSGGKRKGADFTQQIAFSLDIDWEKLVGWKGFSTHAIIMNRSGRNASADYVGDSQIQAQEVYGGGYARLLHMYDLYAEQKLWHDNIDIKIGRMSVGDDYAHSAIACQFMLLTTCGHPRSTQSQQGFSDWPGAVWGGRILYKITTQAYIQVGAYQSTPWPQGGRTGWDWGTSQTTGAFVPVELGYNPDIGKDNLLGHIHVGTGIDSSRFETWSSQVTGSGKKDNRFQFWIQADQMVYRNDPIDDHGLFVIANYGHDAATTSSFKDFYNIGLLDRGFWKARSYDQFGLMLTYYTVPRGLSRAQQYQINNGQVTGANGIFNGLLNGAPGVQTNSLLFEANYGIAAYRGVMLMPIFEYFHNVAATRSTYKDAVLFGLKTNVTF
ncbi:carbohydrate porin [Commensalibacter papalotli (ex Servin-Garciduenas et al. 2014)]|uniref:Porin n=1 Tax=Commensalibacter papalotli (ex Servin-Garciduenas et al. 2014) TaxID=1208583 RepID=W7DXV6_9PROT|nr:carbohydrate porin [Commensalibacter papalotli (ex Servin-Garciduenas et al. 2014)]EUK17439.1 porin [Commensalibacter papalotli (ex Servin-Garciduenas et al. 2014)]